jgi:hypothetical protein
VVQSGNLADLEGYLLRGLLIPVLLAPFLACGHKSGSSYSGVSSSRDAGPAMTMPPPCSSICFETIASNQEDALAVTVDATNVYWLNGISNRYSLVRAPLAGGAPVTLDRDRAAGTDVTTDGTLVYWYARGALLGVPVGGGAAITIAQTQYFSKGLLTDGADLFYTTGYAILQQPIGGGTATTLVGFEPANNPQGIAISPTNVYWSELSGHIATVAKGGGGVATLFSNAIDPESVAVNATDIFWVEFGGIPDNASIVKMPLGGGTATTILANQQRPVSLAADSDFVYLANFDNSSVVKVPVTGGPMVGVYSEAHARPTAVAIDGTSVYWTDAYLKTVDRITPK